MPRERSQPVNRWSTLFSGSASVSEPALSALDVHAGVRKSSTLRPSPPDSRRCKRTVEPRWRARQPSDLPDRQRRSPIRDEPEIGSPSPFFLTEADPERSWRICHSSENLTHVATQITPMPQPSAWLHAHRAPRRHQHHRRADRPATSRGSGGARGSTANQVHKQSQAARARVPQLRR